MRLALSILIYLTGFLLFPADIVADEIVVTPDGAEDSSDKSDDKKKKESKLPDFDELIEGYEKIEGLFDLYWKQEENKAFMAIHPDQLGEVFLFSETRQSGDASSFDSGAMLGDYPFRFQRVGDRIQLIHLNTRYRADGETPMSRAMENSISNSIVVSTEIKCKPDSTTTAYLLDLRALFITDEHTLVEYRTGEWKQKYSLDDDNSFFNSLKSFPMNTEIDVSLHYYSSKPHRSTTLPDSRSMLHRYHYSISAIPETDYKPRLADDRLGHFITLFQDYSSVEKDSPYTYYINRWDLRKKDPGATLSEVEKPVVYWLENTIPEKYREACRKGILLWNDAFERIGFKNAIVVKQMPDDADWDPADVRYNTIRWIVQPGGGYAVGPSRANPFTGEIYDADIRISADFVRHFYREHDEWVTPLSVNEIIAQGLDDSHQHKEAGCRYADEKQQQMAFGWNLLTSQELVRPDDLDKFVQDGLIDLVVHEVGHTLGLRHNFKASHIYPLKQLEDKKFTETHGITGSVMDYTPINLSKRENAQGAYFQTVLGFYDHWVMEYAYSQFPEGEKTEKEYLEEIASRSGEALLEYCTDYDARGYSIGGMDPGCSLYDMTSDPLEYYALRVDLVQELWQSLLDLYSLDGARYQKFYQVFNQGIGEYRNMARNVTKYIGGIYVSRHHIGDAGDRTPYTVVPADEQREALDFLMRTLFQADAFLFDPELLNRMVPEIMGDFSGSVWSRDRLEFPAHNAVLQIQGIALSRLYSTSVLDRLQDNELRNNNTQDQFLMAELFGTLRKEIWSETLSRKNINSFRRELQRMHLRLLSDIVLTRSGDVPQDAVSLALNDLHKLSTQFKRVENNKSLDEITRAHLKESRMIIEATLSASLERKM